MCYINCVALSFHPHFYSCIFHPLHYRADLSTPAFSTPAFSVPLYVTPSVKAMLRRKNRLMRVGRVNEADALATPVNKIIVWNSSK